MSSGSRGASAGTLLALIVLSSCVEGAPARGPDVDATDVPFDIRRVEVGHPTAAAVVSDVDGDGRNDALLAGGPGVIVLGGDGSGGLTLRETVDAGEHPVDLAVGDLDGDGRPDVVVANHEMDYVTVVTGGADGLASGRTTRVLLDVSPHPHAVALGDVDGDGRLDLLVDDRDRERVVVLRGRGDGSFEPGSPIGVGGDPYRGMALVDLDGDGELDVVTPNPREVVVRLGDGRGGFTAGPILPSPEMPPFAAAVGDFDGDGFQDVAAGSGEGRGAVRLWRGGPEGVFAPSPGGPVEVGVGPTALAVGDLDGDGTDDVAATSYVGNELAVVWGGGRREALRLDLGDNPWGLGAGDLDGDGRPDLVVTHDGGTRVTVLLSRPEPSAGTPGGGRSPE